jgi:hypothetical protein
MNRRRMVYARFLATIAVVPLAGLVEAQGVMFGRVAGIPPNDVHTRFTGRADQVLSGAGTIYRGNVAITFPDSKIVVIADEIVFDEKAAELTVSGRVRLRLNAK